MRGGSRHSQMLPNNQMEPTRPEFSRMMSPRGSFGALGRIQKILRFSLLDLLIAQATVVLGCILIDGLARFVAHSPLSLHLTLALGLPTGVLFYLCVTPPLYKHFGLLPLLLPVCPHCNKRPNGYRVNEHGWPRMIVACGQCDRVSELWWRRPSAASVPPGSPRLLLSWPHSLGRWRLIARETL